MNPTKNMQSQLKKINEFQARLDSKWIAHIHMSIERRRRQKGASHLLNKGHRITKANLSNVHSNRTRF